MKHIYFKSTFFFFFFLSLLWNITFFTLPKHISQVFAPEGGVKILSASHFFFSSTCSRSSSPMWVMYMYQLNLIVWVITYCSCHSVTRRAIFFFAICDHNTLELWQRDDWYFADSHQRRDHNHINRHEAIRKLPSQRSRFGFCLVWLHLIFTCALRIRSGSI